MSGENREKDVYPSLQELPQEQKENIAYRIAQSWDIEDQLLSILQEADDVIEDNNPLVQSAIDSFSRDVMLYRLKAALDIGVGFVAGGLLPILGEEVIEHIRNTQFSFDQLAIFITLGLISGTLTGSAYAIRDLRKIEEEIHAFSDTLFAKEIERRLADHQVLPLQKLIPGQEYRYLGRNLIYKGAVIQEDVNGVLIALEVIDANGISYVHLNEYKHLKKV